MPSRLASAHIILNDCCLARLVVLDTFSCASIYHFVVSPESPKDMSADIKQQAAKAVSEDTRQPETRRAAWSACIDGQVCILSGGFANTT